MINRTIISVEPGPDGAFIKVRKSPDLLPEATQLRPFHCDPSQMPAWTADQAVQAHGQQIHAALCAAHPAIKQALLNLRNTPNGAVHSLFFHLVADEAERLHWEALCDDLGAFFALDGRWPIARMADSPLDRAQPARREFAPPLRFVAILSAIGITARPEWQRLRTVITNARQAGLAIDLALFVGEEELLNEIQAELDNGSLPNTDVAFVTTNMALENAITRLQPHILHFFCHGANTHGAARLELASMQDWLIESLTSSVVVNINDLLNLSTLDRTWLVTLNCCEGAKAGDAVPAHGTSPSQLNSMVRQLVERGVPAAVGMIEAIDASDAHEFCAGFYTALFNNFQNILNATPIGAEVELDWELALRPARINVNNRNGGAAPTQRAWILPALYVQVDRFRLVRANQQLSAELEQKANEVARALRALPPDTPLSMRAQLLALLDELPPHLRPNHFGVFE